MLTITALTGSSVSLSDGTSTVVAFPAKPDAKAITLLSTPEETPRAAVLSWPGEYDIAGVAIRGIGHNEGEQVSFALRMDDYRIALPSTPLAEWTSDDMSHLGDVQILVLPAEDPKKCQALLDEIDPRVLILVPSSDGSMHADVLKVAGAVGKETVSEYKIKGALPAEGREVVVMGE